MRAPPPVAFALCTLIWGTTWWAIKVGYEGIDPVFGAFLRFGLAGLIMLPILLAKRTPLPRTRQHLLLVLGVAVLMFFLDYGLIYWAETRVHSGLTSVLFATFPFFTALAAAALLPAERVTPWQLAGMGIGFLGLLFVFREDLGSDGGLIPALAIVVAAATGATSGVLVRRWGRDLAPMSLNATSMLLGAALLLPASLLLGETPSLPRTNNAWLALAYLVFAGSILSFLLYWDLLKRWPANRAAAIPLSTPVVALVLGHIVEQPLTLLQWFGSAITLAGVALALLPRSRPTPTPSTPLASLGK